MNNQRRKDMHENTPARRVEDKRADSAVDWTDAPRFTSLGIAETWSVTVEAEGRRVLCISDQHYAGLAEPELTQFEGTIRSCAQHLLGFIGAAPISSTAGAARSGITNDIEVSQVPAAEKPTGDLTDERNRVREEFELAVKLGARFDVDSAMLNVDALARAAIAAYLARKPKAEQPVTAVPPADVIAGAEPSRAQCLAELRFYKKLCERYSGAEALAVELREALRWALQRIETTNLGAGERFQQADAVLAKADDDTRRAEGAAPTAAQAAGSSVTDLPAIKTWQERAVELGEKALAPKTAYGLLQAEIDELRTHLARQAQDATPAVYVNAKELAAVQANDGFVLSSDCKQSKYFDTPLYAHAAAAVGPVAPAAQAEPVRIPQTADEVIAFVGSQFECREDAESPENVRFQLTVHDLQSAFRWWFDAEWVYTVAPAGTQSEEILALHRQLAAEKLRADQGWERADAKSKECIELRERMAGAQNAEAIRNQAVEEGLEMAARHLDKQRQAVDQDHAYQEPDTGAWVFDRPETEEYSNTLAELAEEIRAIKVQTGSANTQEGGAA
jgi:hypothetical protein